MRLQMRGPQSDWTEALRRHAERRLYFALSRFSQSIGVVTVDILSVAGAPGGLDKTCRIVVHLAPKGRILVEDTQEDLYIAIDEATERAGRAVGRQLSFEREMGVTSLRSAGSKGDA